MKSGQKTLPDINITAGASDEYHPEKHHHKSHHHIYLTFT